MIVALIISAIRLIDPHLCALLILNIMQEVSNIPMLIMDISSFENSVDTDQLISVNPSIRIHTVSQSGILHASN